ncbi:hypothetical protein FEI14_09180 [Lacticaseibacillus zeae]|uniref:Uncharacterized protein n=1 Tax=Lacticaseibacillus zeae TaxID=57037 RepID=A0A5R8LUK0_LACZE|nr:hypothetical protein FEI14_09180 [Lacticaseibacillus zeae]
MAGLWPFRFEVLMRRFLGLRARFRDAAENFCLEALARRFLAQRPRFQPINNSRFFPIARLLQVK